MSPCKTGCGTARNSNISFMCNACEDAWHLSPERQRFGFFIHRHATSMVAVVDFCTRVRLERLNGAKP